MHVRLLGAHNSESENTRLSGLVIDDKLALDAGGLTSSLSLPAQKNLKAILLTHQHYDHIRDIPSLAINLFLMGATIDVYATAPVSETIISHFFDGSIYPDYLNQPPENPTLKLNIIEPFKKEQVGEYTVTAVPVNHSMPSVGYEVSTSDGKALFYTGDTGPGLIDCWRHISPALLVIEVTSSNRFDEFCRESGHLTPGMLKQELINFRELKGYFPQVITVHMSPGLEEEIKTELAAISGELNFSITPGYEGMEISL